MKPSATEIARLAALAVASLFSAIGASSQLSTLDDFASDIVKDLKPVKPRLVAVADFRPQSGGAQPQGHYFALLLSNVLEERSKKKFSVANHANFDTDLSNLHLSAESLVPGPAFSSAASAVGADVLITGTFEKRDRDYVLHVTPIRVSDGKSLSTRSQTIVSSEFLQSLVTPFPPEIQNAARGNYRKGVGIPSCIHCPDPSYSEMARSKKIQGTCIVEVLISAEGDPQQVRPLRLLGYGLDEQAFETIKKWKFRPATREDGTPVPVIVPVEVSFRLY